MIQIKPVNGFKPVCPYCKSTLIQNSLIWQGIHVLAEVSCPRCENEFFMDMPVGHALIYPFVIDKKKWKLTGNQLATKWFGRPLLTSLKNPKKDSIKMVIEKKKVIKDVVILNCLDYLYGHTLLKLLNAEKLIRDHKDLGLVVIIPKFLRWMVPEGVAEIWIVDLPLKKAQSYYPDLNGRINKQLERFGKVYLSRAYSHPRDFEIENFTGILPYDFKSNKYRITFVWREDRPWFLNDYLIYALKKINFLLPLIWMQNIKIRFLLSSLKKRLPLAKPTVAGIGEKTQFPSWIDDVRFSKPNDNQERKLCQVYAESAVVIGVHGSNMLLPSGHAGMTLDLVPNIKLGNIAQDVLFRRNISDSRVISFIYRFLPSSSSILTVARTIISMIEKKEEMLKSFLTEEYAKTS
jgi:hypothetical protein